MRIANIPRFVASVLLIVGLVWGAGQHWTVISVFFADAQVQAAVVVLGIALGVLGFIGRELVISTSQDWSGIRFTAGREPDLRVIIYGAGGVGKTTLLNREFYRDRGVPNPTKDLEVRSGTFTLNEKPRTFETIDVEGQREWKLRQEKLRELRSRGRSVHAVVCLVGFHPVDKTKPLPRELLVPGDPTERKRVVEEYTSEQSSDINGPVAGDLVNAVEGHRAVYLLYNQMDLLTHKSMRARVRFAEKTFSGVEKAFRSELEGNNHVSFKKLFVSATEGVVYAEDGEVIQTSAIDLFERLEAEVSR